MSNFTNVTQSSNAALTFVSKSTNATMTIVSRASKFIWAASTIPWAEATPWALDGGSPWLKTNKN